MDDFISKLAPPRPVWMMVTAAVVDSADKLLSAMRFQFGGHHEKPGDNS